VSFGIISKIDPIEKTFIIQTPKQDNITQVNTILCGSLQIPTLCLQLPSNDLRVKPYFASSAIHLQKQEMKKPMTRQLNVLRDYQK
jgi:hypothetical protein